MPESPGSHSIELPVAAERLLGAAGSLNSAEMRERLTEWRGLPDRASAIEAIEGGARLAFDAAEPMAPIADLVTRESECCAFYTFTLHIDGPSRHLEVSAGIGGEPAVRAVIGLAQVE